MIFDRVITIFNKEFDKKTRTDKYVRHVIEGCFVDEIQYMSTSKNGPDNADSVFIGVPNDNITIIPKKGDFVIKGEVKEDYQSLKDMQLNYDCVYTITKVDLKDFGSYPHYEIAGK